MRHCKVCKSTYAPAKPLQSVCSPWCALSIATSKRAKALKVEQVKERRADKVKRETLKPRSQWLKEAKTAIQRFRRLDELAMMARRNIWPTATATAYKGWSPGHNRAATDDRLDYSVERAAFTIGQKTPPMRLNHYWVEWLMGFPIGFTVSKDWVTPSARCKPQQPTACLEATE